MHKNKVLIVDDEVDIRELLGDFLEDEGYECHLAQNSKEAIEIYKNKNIDLVMSDIRMPGLSGLELLSELKKLDNNVMVIMISAVKDIEFAISAMSKGAYDYISKPFKLNEVSLIAEKAIHKKELIEENIQYQKNLEKKVRERTVELRGTLDKLNKTYTNTLRALVLALDTRDSETQGHSTRVVHYCLLLAKLMNITDPEELKVLEYAAILHDIGKIGIPDAILRKPGKLSSEEWEIMETHPILGYNMINRIDFLKDASTIVLHHHEKFNGKGYPTGLAGDDIPRGSRIFMVADTFDAMTSDRPYRKALSFEITIKELKKFRNTQFDPQIVDAFLKVPLAFWKKERDNIEAKLQTIDLFNLNI
jgi:response regulator RpfG family c-di-GMP phosphodiesterase